MDTNAPFIDDNALISMKELGFGDGDFAHRPLIVQLISVYLNNLDERVSELNKGMTLQDAHVVERAAHSLKSSSRLVGLLKLADECQYLEDLGASKNLAQSSEPFKKILEFVEKARVVLPEKVIELEKT